MRYILTNASLYVNGAVDGEGRKAGQQADAAASDQGPAAGHEVDMVERVWNDLGFWQYQCGCAQFQDGWERCPMHRAPSPLPCAVPDADVSMFQPWVNTESIVAETSGSWEPTQGQSYAPPAKGSRLVLIYKAQCPKCKEERVLGQPFQAPFCELCHEPDGSLTPMLVTTEREPSGEPLPRRGIDLGGNQMLDKVWPGRAKD